MSPASQKTTTELRPAFRLKGPGLDIPMGPPVLLMGILNVTPDSFSDGGMFPDVEAAVRRAEVLVEEGADLVDIGGESSRPGAGTVSADEESRRVIPVIEAMAGRISVPISIDTIKARVARRALAAGACIINDISALRFDPEMAPLVAREGVPVVLMHRQGSAKDMQVRPVYKNVVRDIRLFFESRLSFAKQAGIDPDRIILDPGIGFGKTAEHNLEILLRLDEFRSLGRPLLIGPSRKSFIGHVLGLPVEERVEGTTAAVVTGVLKGVSMIRVHDVREMARAVRMTEAIRYAGGRGGSSA